LPAASTRVGAGIKVGNVRILQIVKVTKV